MKSLKDNIYEGLNADVQGSIRDWYRNYWRERLAINRKVKYIKKAIKKYKLRQQELGLIDMDNN